MPCNKVNLNYELQIMNYELFNWKAPVKYGVEMDLGERLKM